MLAQNRRALDKERRPGLAAGRCDEMTAVIDVLCLPENQYQELAALSTAQQFS
jgi:hypothetical protein